MRQRRRRQSHVYKDVRLTLNPGSEHKHSSTWPTVFMWWTGSPIQVAVSFVDVAYSVYVMDGKFHTGSCVVMRNLEAVHCRSS